MKITTLICVLLFLFNPIAGLINLHEKGNKSVEGKKFDIFIVSYNDGFVQHSLNELNFFLIHISWADINI